MQSSHLPVTTNLESGPDSYTWNLFYKSLKTTAADYTTFGEFSSNHRALWIDSDITHALGYTLPDFTWRDTGHLEKRDPQVVSNFKKYYTSFLTTRQLI